MPRVDNCVTWLNYADNSYIASRLLWFTGFFREAPVNAHRAIELYLKSLLIGYGLRIEKGSPAWGHRIGSLCSEAVKFDSTFNDCHLMRRVVFFERYFDYVRYPSDPGSPNDGSYVWYSFDSNITPLDEIVAFIRPRINISSDDWASTVISQLLVMKEEAQTYQIRALKDSNQLLDTINTDKTYKSSVVFNENFNFDKPGC